MKCQKPTCLSALKTVTSNINSIGSLYSIKSTFVSRKFLTLQQTDNLTVDILLYRLWRYMYPVVWKCSQSQLIQTGVGRTFGECTCNGSVSRVTTVPRGVYLPQPEQHPQKFGQPSELRTHASLKHRVYMYISTSTPLKQILRYGACSRFYCILAWRNLTLFSPVSSLILQTAPSSCPPAPAAPPARTPVAAGAARRCCREECCHVTRAAPALAASR